jgi:uncharacterized membrane protein
VLSIIFIAAGTLHFIFHAYYRLIVPRYLPSPATLVAVSGVLEIAGGIGLLLPKFRRFAALGLIILLIAVLPANVEMLQQHQASGGPRWQELVLWLRLPFQGILIWWTWRVSQTK